MTILHQVECRLIFLSKVTLSELPEKDDVEEKAENDESEEDCGQGVKPTSGEHGQVTGLQVDQNFGSRKLLSASWYWAID